MRVLLGFGFSAVLCGLACGAAVRDDTWITLSALNSMRRDEPEKVNDLWFNQYTVDMAAFRLAAASATKSPASTSSSSEKSSSLSPSSALSSNDASMRLQSWNASAAQA